MPLEIGAHWDETQLEQYALRKLPEPEVEALEEHLLVCEVCQQNLARTDEYVSAMRSVSARLRAEDEQREESWLPSWLVGAQMAWVMAAAAVLLGAAAFVNWRKAETWTTAPAAVFLEATRGVESPVGAQAPSGVPFRVKLDVRGLPAEGSWEVEIVDANGRQVWRGALSAAGETAEGRVDARLKPGQHFVRLRSAWGELQREFSLKVR